MSSSMDQQKSHQILESIPGGVWVFVKVYGQQMLRNLKQKAILTFRVYNPIMLVAIPYISHQCRRAFKTYFHQHTSKSESLKP